VAATAEVYADQEIMSVERHRHLVMTRAWRRIADEAGE